MAIVAMGFQGRVAGELIVERGEKSHQPSAISHQLVLMTAVLVLVSGCHRPAGVVFPAGESELVWPLPPEAPRVRYVGELHGSADLRAARSGWQAVRDALGSPESRPIPITTPHAIAFGQDGRVYVVDTGSASLHVIDLARRTHRRVNTAGEEHLRSPVGVAVGSSGVFVSDAVLRDVFEFDFDGNFRRRLGVELERPAGIAYCAENRRLYVVDSGGHRCVALDENGRELFSFGGRGSEPGMFNYPTHITCSGLLGVIVSDTLNFRVQRFELDGTFVSSIGEKGNGAGDFSLPKGVAVDRDGNLYVVDAHFENVQMFRADGRLLLAFGEEGVGVAQFAIPAGVAIDPDDRVWIADSRNGRLQVFQYIGRSGKTASRP